MGRDTQIGVILGMVILVIIGVFLSTRSSMKETDMPVLALPEESVSVVEEIDIFDLAKEPEAVMTEVQETSKEENEKKQTAAEFNTEESPVKYGTLMEGKWEGIAPELKDKEQELSGIQDDVEESVKPPLTPKNISQEMKTGKPRENSKAVSVVTRKEIIHTVRSNENLVALAKKYYGDETKWRVIFDANRHKLANPNVLYVGLKLQIPNQDVLTEVSGGKAGEKHETQISGNKKRETRTYTIRRGDTLHSIANKLYNDGSKWWEIYEANEDTIEDKNILIIGDTLIIPE
ncbi:MAG: LysM peptidoglycan-binding domain-containing protein [Candidatus Scalindua sp.]|nr:LysM peptidoglycan-binding domain-containing protein [Candidatus Scalindua sp.]